VGTVERTPRGAPHAAAPGIDPYRLLFPLGALYAVLGAWPWAPYGLGGSGYPALLHRTLMIQGFEQCFVLGFLLTAMPGLIHAERVRRLELAAALAAAILFGLGALGGRQVVAQGAFLLSLAVLLQALVRRLPTARVEPPQEMIFVLLGLGLGALGGAMELLAAAGHGIEPVPRFGARLISLGMVLSLVLGVGGLLVPVFAGMRDPLVIAGIARPHERHGRRAFYLALATALALAFVLEATGHGRSGAGLRALAATTLGLTSWKLGRLPGRRDRFGFALWGAGWMVLAGLWLMVLAPRLTLAGLHVVFIGGFGLLTLAIGTRVVVAHGRHPSARELAVLSPWVVGAALVALALRVAAETLPSRPRLLLSASAAAWIAAWLLWAASALPLVAHTRRPAPLEQRKGTP
jgi:uncharacterized protein involved in response to NO